jgi:hypothetical protein
MPQDIYENEVHIVELPKFVGYFNMYGIMMSSEKKPSL